MEWRNEVRPQQLDTPGLARRALGGVETDMLQGRLLHAGFNAALTQLLAARPTRAALAWSIATPLTPYPEVESEFMHCAAITFNAAPPAGSLGEACEAFRLVNGLAP